MSSNLGLLELVFKASPFAQGILIILITMLYFTLWYILRKRIVLRRYQKSCDLFEQDFWSGKNIETLEKRARQADYHKVGLVQLFLFAQDEFKKACEVGGDDVNMITESVRRTLDVAIQNEEEFLARHMQFLATVASVSPYIGLLGTVWGIISAFQSLTNTSQATIALVAPGIAEALIATAMGLLAAIPAVIAYNYFSTRIDRFSLRFDTFANRYLNLITRNL